MLRDSCFRNTGDARRPHAAFDREGGGRETRARGDTGPPAAPEVPQAEGLQATSEQPVQEGQARPERQVGGPSEISVPLVHDIMAVEALWGLVEEEVEEEQKPSEQEGRWVEEAQELQVKQQKKERVESGLRPCPSPLEALEALQIELQPVNKQASREHAPLQLRMWQRRQRHLEQRSALIQGIRGFWAKAFVNHPQMSALISKPDESMLRHRTNLKVEEHKFPRECRKILLFFVKNSYFQNEVVTKEYVLGLAGYRASHSSPIQWHPRYRQEAYRRRHDNSSLNFFNWFSDHSFAGSSRIAEIIIEDLWPNPLPYFKMKEAPGERTERERGICTILRRV
ncbi:testis-specific Y-encoded protein 3-like [Neofelis nebulosa]|uniref:testis-specific Y-encoded protein 3-like n=1 Tax=Neofelis nebulosa TaxID=61452 RepID=UPI00272BCF29|nr:testis-specific Y-encoded protein 3-like [Neofelis nebulosa]